MRKTSWSTEQKNHTSDCKQQIENRSVFQSIVKPFVRNRFFLQMCKEYFFFSSFAAFPTLVWGTNTWSLRKWFVAAPNRELNIKLHYPTHKPPWWAACVNFQLKKGTRRKLCRIVPIFDFVLRFTPCLLSCAHLQSRSRCPKCWTRRDHTRAPRPKRLMRTR